MGDMAEMMTSGLLCETCGTLVDGTEPGYPRKCGDCGGVPDLTEEEIAENMRDAGYECNG